LISESERHEAISIVEGKRDSMDDACPDDQIDNARASSGSGAPAI
jgi:hypothetical protein